VAGSVLAYLGIVLGILILALVRALLDKRPKWRAFFGFLGRVEVAVIGLLLGALIVFGCLQIFLRNVFHSGIIWADPLMRHIVLWLGCLGGATATARIRHISIDIFSRFLPGPLQAFRDRIIYLATALVSSVLGMAALRLVAQEKEFGEQAFLNVDVWVLQIVIPFAFFLITYRSLLNAFLGRKAKPLDWEEVHGAEGMSES
jgi:TRAP-type C4-dicarboxylate transport system permease small subunit